MDTLFSLRPEFPEGFYYYPDFITEEEEKNLVELIADYPLRNMIFQGFEVKRKVMSFGYDYHFDNQTLTKGIPIPEKFEHIISKIGNQLNIPAEKFVKLLLTEYSRGTVINWHRDAQQFEKIAGLSLLSDCVFKLRPPDKSKQTRAATSSFTVERRSLYLMENVARDEWEHSISPVKVLRYSITIRTLRNKTN